MRYTSTAVLLLLAVIAPHSARATVLGYQNSVLSESSLLGYYTFDTANNGAGDVASAVTDASGNGYTGSSKNVDGTNGSFVAGAPDGSGVGKYYSNLTLNTSVFAQPVTSPGWPAAGNGTPYSFFDGTGTVSFWFTHSGVGGNKLAVGIRESVGGTRYSIHMDGPGNAIGLWTGSNFSTISAGGINIDDGGWHHLAVVFDGAPRYVLDGVDLGTTPAAIFNADVNIDELGIGATPDTLNGGEAWLGNLDEVAFFEDALSVAAIQSQYDAMAAVPEPSSFALAALGLVGLGWFGIRRRKG